MKIELILMMALTLCLMNVSLFSFAENLETHNSDNMEESIYSVYENSIRKGKTNITQEYVFLSEGTQNTAGTGNADSTVRVEFYNGVQNIADEAIYIGFMSQDTANELVCLNIRYKSEIDNEPEFVDSNGNFATLSEIVENAKVVSNESIYELVAILDFDSLSRIGYYVDTESGFIVTKLSSSVSNIEVLSMSTQFPNGGASVLGLEKDEEILENESVMYAEYSMHNSTETSISYGLNNNTVVATVENGKNIEFYQDGVSDYQLKIDYSLESSDVDLKDVEINIDEQAVLENDIEMDVEDESGYLSVETDSSTVYTDVYKFLNGKDILKFNHTAGLLGTDLLVNIYGNDTKALLNEISYVNADDLLGLEYDSCRDSDSYSVIIKSTHESQYAGEMRVLLDLEESASNNTKSEAQIASPSDAARKDKTSDVCKTFFKGENKFYTVSEESVFLTEERLRRMSYCALDITGRIIAVYDNSGKLNCLLGGYSEEDIYSYVVIPSNKEDLYTHNTIDEIVITYNDELADDGKYAEVLFAENFIDQDPVIVISGNESPDTKSSVVICMDYNNKLFMLQENQLEESLSIDPVDDWSLVEQFTIEMNENETESELESESESESNDSAATTSETINESAEQSENKTENNVKDATASIEDIENAEASNDLTNITTEDSNENNGAKSDLTEMDEYTAVEESTTITENEKDINDVTSENNCIDNNNNNNKLNDNVNDNLDDEINDNLDNVNNNLNELVNTTVTDNELDSYNDQIADPTMIESNPEIQDNYSIEPINEIDQYNEEESISTIDNYTELENAEQNCMVTDSEAVHNLVGDAFANI